MRKKKVCERKESASQSANRRRHFAGDHVDDTLPNFTTVQPHESLLRDVEPDPSGVDGGKVNRHTRRRIGQAPAPAAVRRVPHDVERTANERERRNITERREARDQTVRPIRARDAVQRAVLIVVCSVERGSQGRRWCIRAAGL
jgi:hypothetical protein